MALVLPLAKSCFWTPVRELSVLTSVELFLMFASYYFGPLFFLFFLFFSLKKKKKKEKESWKFSTNQVCFAKLITSSNLNGLSVLVESQAFFVPWKPNGTSQLKEERDQEI